MATITASGDLVCFGLTFWEFRPLVHDNGAIAWKLLQSMAKMLRAAQQGDAPLDAPATDPAGAEEL
jgi:CRP-like cAMP-binding protein